MSDRQSKKELFETGNLKKGKAWIIATLAVSVAGLSAFLLFPVQNSSATVQGKGGVVSIPLSEVEDGKARFYTYRAGDSDIPFFVLKSGDGVVRAALDTCDVCYKARKGYRQEGDFMVCNNCNQKFKSDLINEIKGGCNPIPLSRTIEEGTVRIPESELLGGARFFSVGG